MSHADIKKNYDDPKLLMMLEGIITNPIDTPYGYKNPGYQDDILILCNTKRQLNRCWRKMLDILGERRLSLSHKKTRKGKVSSGFHFLGVYYSPTQPESNTTVIPVNDAIMVPAPVDQNLCNGGGKTVFPPQQVALRMIPHARTLRKAREQVKSMVTDGASPRHIRKYLARWIQWWNETVDDWSKTKLVQWFCRACFDVTPAAYAAGLLLRQIRESRIASRAYAHCDSVLTSLRSAA